MKPTKILVEMRCTACGRVAKTDLNYEDIRESGDHRAAEPSREILLGCKDCQTHIRIFIPERLMVKGSNLITDATDGIETNIIMI